jgi:hypothetical protein
MAGGYPIWAITTLTAVNFYWMKILKSLSYFYRGVLSRQAVIVGQSVSCQPVTLNIFKILHNCQNIEELMCKKVTDNVDTECDCFLTLRKINIRSNLYPHPAKKLHMVSASGSNLWWLVTLREVTNWSKIIYTKFCKYLRLGLFIL